MSDPQDLVDRIRAAAPAIEAQLQDTDVERLMSGIHQRRRRRAVGRLALFAGAMAAAGALAVAIFHRTPTGNGGVSAPPPTATAAGPTRLQLADGSVVTRLEPATALEVIENQPAHITLDLGRGRERFEVVPRPAAQRSFRVRAGAVTVTVIGTIFTIERVADRIGVVVERGTVRVDWANGTRPLRAGEGGWFPPLRAAEEDGIQAGQPEAAPGGEPRPDGEEDDAPHPAKTDAVAAPAGPGKHRSTTTQAAAEVRATPPPVPLLPPSPPVAPPPAGLDPPTPEQVLAAADSARAAGRDAEAVALLRRLLADWPGDARAPLAAFTLGRLLMRDPERALDAAAAFAQARALAPAGPLAEDALAREAEVLARAGSLAAARARAREYLGLYPLGHRATKMKMLGGDSE